MITHVFRACSGTTIDLLATTHLLSIRLSSYLSAVDYVSLRPLDFNCMAALRNENPSTAFIEAYAWQKIHLRAAPCTRATVELVNFKGLSWEGSMNQLATLDANDDRKLDVTFFHKAALLTDHG